MRPIFVVLLSPVLQRPGDGGSYDAEEEPMPLEVICYKVVK